jgi:hypothetical protein
MVTKLRLYTGSEDVETLDRPVDSTVTIRLGDLIPLVATAQRRHFTWLQDFLEDEVAISSDLHDVLMAFRSCRPSA